MTVSPVHADSPDNPWYATTYRLQEIWELTRGEGVTVAVIDSGVNSSMPELEGQVLEGVDLTRDPDGPHVDEDGHGTGMASLIAGTGEQGGVRGLAPGVKILPIRVGQRNGQPDFGRQERMGQAIQYAVDEGARVINISQAAVEIGQEEAVDAALEAAARADVLIFAGTGNEGDTRNRSMYPANRYGVVGVAAVDRNGERSPYSTYGRQVAIAAPADEIPWRCPDLSGPVCLDPQGGTSTATALASASAALIWAAHPDWTKNQVLRVMMETAQRDDSYERDDYIGHGMIRPDRVILDGEGDPGDPRRNPLFAGYEATLDPPPSPRPAAPDDAAGEAGAAGAQDQEPARDEEEEARQAVGLTGGGGSTGPVVLAGLLGVVLVGGVAAVVVQRRRAATDVHSR
ncbi:S8 family serine peptidase [Streptomyces avicenniae]|uniref:S8 family serine peptidase n=1 Tax=Streptomyces avicenniae TaxID=500153 RepID=UPI00167E6DBA|nr:S8 family serine peptidase [Streptomyces avicenniae]